MNFQNDEAIVRTFVEETREHLTEMEDGILQLESSGGDIDNELIHSMFRAAHSIKAGANLLKFHTIESLSHTLENLLQDLRQSRVALTREVVDGFLRGIDRMREMVNAIRVPAGHR